MKKKYRLDKSGALIELGLVPHVVPTPLPEGIQEMFLSSVGKEILGEDAWGYPRTTTTYQAPNYPQRSMESLEEEIAKAFKESDDRAANRGYL